MSRQNTFNDIAYRMPRSTTDRKKDLANLLSAEESFIILSDYRNGTTTLMKDFVSRVDGILVDAMILEEGNEIVEINRRLATNNKLFLLDEVGVFFRRIGDIDLAINFFHWLSKNRQVGLRLHLEYLDQANKLSKKWFEIIKIEKIPYDELIMFYNSKLDEEEFLLLEKYIKYAYETYYSVAKIVWFIGQAYRLIFIDNEWKMPSLKEVTSECEQTPLFKNPKIR